jgi:hypothetical protein
LRSAASPSGCSGRKSGESFIRQFFEGSGAPDVADKVAEKGSSMLTSFATQAFQLGLGFLVAMLVVGITGIYLAAQPKIYRWGIAAVFHPLHRAKVLQVIELVETTVKYWLIGQIILMIIISLLTYGTLLILGLPSPVALALIAGIAEIVPYLGPFIGAVPALLVALTLGFVPAVWTVGAYLMVHLIEGYIAGAAGRAQVHHHSAGAHPAGPRHRRIDLRHRRDNPGRPDHRRSLRADQDALRRRSARAGRGEEAGVGCTRFAQRGLLDLRRSFPEMCAPEEAGGRCRSTRS